MDKADIFHFSRTEPSALGRLDESESLASRALAEMGIGLWAFELDNDCPPRMYGNRQMDELLGCDGPALTPEEYYHAWFDNVHPNHYAEIKKSVDAMIGGKLSEVQYPFCHPTRGEMWVRCGGMRDPKYVKGIRIIGRHQDVSELIHVQKIADAEHEHAKLCAEAYKAIYTHDTVDSFLKDFAPMLLETFGADQVVYIPLEGKRIDVFRPGVPPPVGEACDDCALRKGGMDLYKNGAIEMADAHDKTLAHHVPDTCPIKSCIADTIIANGVTAGLFVVRYLREPHEFTTYERATFGSIVRSLSWALERRNEELARSQFFASVAHDIRTPLNGIVGLSELLEQGVADDAERDRFIRAIRSSGKMLARLVNDVLDLSKLENGKLELLTEPTDVMSLTREVAASFDFVSKRAGFAIVTEIDEVPVLMVDPQRIRQILYNLIGNAVKFTHTGSVTVRVRWRDGALDLEVEDTGEGIAPENLARILRPFEQVADRNRRTGSGLGLSICQKLASLMGGALSVRSTLGVGSTFTLHVPNAEVVRDAGQATPAAAAETASVRKANLRVLVADDSALNQLVLKNMLSRCGIVDVVVADNGREALERLQRDGAFDAVLTDLRMPEMDGEELVAAIRSDAKLAGLPVYLITADADARNEYESKGFTGVLLKPITIASVQALFR